MPVVLMRCPRCGQTADVSENLAEEGQRCYRCNVAVEAAEPAPEAAADAPAGRTWLPVLLGALIVVGVVKIAALAGGPVGMAVVGAFAGALIGVIVGVVQGVVGGLEWGALTRDGSWLPWTARVMLGLGLAVGAYAGATGELVAHVGPLGVMISAKLGALAVGAWLGRWSARRRD